MGDYSPEKAGVGGSIPSLATMFFNNLRASNSPILGAIWAQNPYCTTRNDLLKRSTTVRCDSGTNCW